VVSITNEAIFKKQKEKIANYKKQLAGQFGSNLPTCFSFSKKKLKRFNSRAVISKVIKNH
jgi:hypothetical protein